MQNEKALETEIDAERCSELKDANKYCRILLGRMKQTNGFIKSMLVITVGFAVGAAIMSGNMGDWDLKKLHEMLGNSGSWDLNEFSEMLVKLAEMIIRLPLKI